MSFSQLPNETLQLIVDKCDQADQAYNARQDLADDAPRAAGWTGRSCSAMSMVNKTLRTMASKYVFKTLYASKAEHDTFQYGILDGPLRHCFTRLVFDQSSERKILAPALFQLVVRIVPLLPNLTAISGLRNGLINTLTGAEGLDSPRRGPLCPLREIRAGAVLCELARKITDWDVQLLDDDVKVLVNANPNGIKHLRLSSPDCNGFLIFESSKSRFPSILANLTNLSTLVIKPSARQSYDGNDVVPIAKSVLKTRFSFVHSLRTLHLDVTRDDYANALRDIEFAALFPSLTRLTLNLNLRGLSDLDPQRSFNLPKLEHLELRYGSFPTMSWFSQCLHLPVIEEIEFNSIESDADANPDEIEGVVQALSTYTDTLRTVKISATHGLPLGILELFRELIPDVKLELDPFTRTWLGCDVFYRGQPETFLPGAHDPIHEKTTELLEWARGQAESAKGKDLEGGRELYRAMEAIEELKRWKEE